MKKIYEGRTRDEAIVKACTELNVARDELHFEVASDEGRGLYRRVRIRVLKIDKREDVNAPMDNQKPEKSRP